jgi:hypothetical protein
MPFRIRKLPNQNKYRVYNPITGKIYAERATRKNAEAQVKLLYLIERRRYGRH